MCMCDWCISARIRASEQTMNEEAKQTVHSLVDLKRRIQAGDYARDRISDNELLILHRLSFLRWAIRHGKVSEALPVEPSRFDLLIEELMSRPVVPVADLVAEERMRRTIPASDEQEE